MKYILKILCTRYFYSIIILTFILLSSCNPSRKNLPTVSNGVIDLRNWNFDVQADSGTYSTVKLDGEWEFYWNQLYTYKDFQTGNVDKPNFIKVPGIWNDYKVNGQKISGFGYATFRIKIITGKKFNNISFKFLDEATAYNFFINDILISSNGIVSRNQEESKPKLLPRIANFKSESDEFYAILQISNFTDTRGGFWQSIFIGNSEQILSIRERSVTLDLLLTGCLAMMGIYHLALFVLRRKDTSTFWFGLLCLLFSLRAMLLGEKYLIHLFPFLPYELTFRLEFITLCLAISVALFLLRSLFPDEMNRKVFNLFQIFSLSFFAIGILTSITFISSTLLVTEILVIICVIYSLYIIIISIFHKRIGAKIFLVGLLILCISVFNDILFTEKIINTTFVTAYGFLAFMFSQSFVLALRFSRAFVMSETLAINLDSSNKELIQLKEELNIKVIERTKEIEKGIEAFNRSDVKFRTLFNLTHQAVMLLDENGFLDCNEATLLLFGCSSKDEICKKRPSDLSPPYQPSGIDSETLANEQIKIAMKTGENYFEWIHKRINNGVTFPAEVFLSSFYLDGKSVIQALVHDITKRKQTEEKIKQLSQAVEQSPVSIVITDTSGSIQYVNPKFVTLTGYSFEEALGKNPRILKSGEASIETYKQLWDNISMGDVWQGEFHNKKKNGDLYWEFAMISPIINANGQTIQYLAVKEDITERKLLELELKKSKEKAEAANRAKSEFLASMSHEIRTPLNGVIGFTDLLINTELNETQSKYMGIVYQSANSLLDLLNDILDFSKIEAGKLDISIERVDLYELIKQASDLILFKAIENKIKVNLNISSNVPRFIFTDPIRLRQILINLLGNAVKFTAEGEIEIKVAGVHEPPSKAAPSEIQLLFSVRDTGIGITKENQKKIFEAFSQEDSSITRKYGGSGLGLTISNKLLTLLGSQLELESEQGKGSNFYFTLTAKVEDGTIIKQNTMTLDDSNVNEQLILPEHVKVLIVDDVEVNLFLARSLLTKIMPHCKIIKANNGNQAIEQFQKEKPDIIFMDVQMPEMNGYDAAIEIRKIENGNRIPIIALTAGTVKEEIDKCFEAGMNDYASKPIVKDKIDKLLHKWLSK